MHKSALDAAAVSLYADSQGKFPELDTLLTVNFKGLNKAKILDLAEKIGFERIEVEKQMKNPILLKKIQKDILDGQKAGVQSIPRIFINGRLLKKQTLGEVQKLIDEEVKKSTPVSP